MNILVVAGCCLKQNSSANLCHKAYINGMIELGYNVDLLCYSQEGIVVDESISIPKIDNIFEYCGTSLYEKLALKKGSSQPITTVATSQPEGEYHESFKSKLIGKAKTVVRKSYGIYNPSISWFKKAKKFNSDKFYDYVVSLSYPQVSHLLATYLVKNKKVKCGSSIQIWEDPWTIDLNNSDNKAKSEKAERKLLLSGQKIVYVSPITLKRQQELFVESAEKMTWFPLPAYYSSDKTKQFSKNHYGYFGDYSHYIRNLRPFYETAVKMDLFATICGSSDKPYVSDKNVSVYPRMSLDKLKTHEDNTNVLVCLFNLKGGQIPGKIYQYAASDKTVLAILDGTDEEKRIIKDYFEKYNRFVFCENNAKSIKQAIIKIENNDIGMVKNTPLNCFNAKDIVKDILKNAKD